MQHRSVYHYSIVVKIAHKTEGLEIEYLQRSIFTRCKEPLIIFLKLDGCDVSSVSLELTFKINGLSGASLWYLVYLDQIMCCNAQVLSVSCHGKLVDLCCW